MNNESRSYRAAEGRSRCAAAAFEGVRATLRTWVRGGALAAGLLSLALVPAAATASVIQGTSGAYGIFLDLTITGVASTVGSAQLQNTAPPAYDQNDSTASLSLNSNAVALFPVALNTAVVNARIQSDVDATAGSRFAQGDGSVDDLSLALGLDGTLLDPLLTVSSNQTLSSLARVDGDFGALTASQDSILEGLAISVLGTNISLALDADGRAAANTQLLDVQGVVGLSILLNEQIIGGNGIDDLSAQTNALHILFDAVDLSSIGVAGLTGLLSGEIVVAHTEAALNTTAPATVSVSVPATLPLLLLGLAAGSRIRRR